ncbi:hypothetical protein BHE74_00022758 [Ensete ventricosum]|nr:hypothetical protein BHE74_00022758 [Ensete ventricosum]
MAFDVSYKAICVLNVTICSIWSEPASYASSAGSCALKESVESKESASGFGKLQIDALGVDVGCLAASPEGARSNFDENLGPHSSTKILLGDSSSSKGQHDVVRPASVRVAQQGAEPGDDAWGWFSLGRHDGGDLPPCRVVVLLQEKTFTWGGSPPTRFLRWLS